MNKLKKNQAIELLREYRQELVTELKTMDEAIRQMCGDVPMPIPKPHTTARSVGEQGIIWSKLTAQEAVIHFLKLNPETAYRSSEIGRHLKEQHVAGSDKKTFGSMIATTVRRVEEKGKATRTTVRINDRDVAAFKYKSEVLENT